MVEMLGDILGKEKQRLDTTQEQLGASDVQTYFELPIETINVYIGNIRVNSTNRAGNQLIWGNSSLGIWGSFYWGNSTVANFILGHESFGVLGTSSLGSDYGTASVRQLELKMYQEFTEEFNATTYKKSTTTVSWTDTGSVAFSGTTVIDFTSGSPTARIAASAGSIQLS